MRQTSSASIFPPLVRRIVGLAPRLVALPGPLVETGSTLEVVWAVATRAGEGFGDADGDGEGDGEMDGVGDGGGGGVSWATTTGTIGIGGCSLAFNIR